MYFKIDINANTYKPVLINFGENEQPNCIIKFAFCNVSISSGFLYSSIIDVNLTRL